MRFTFTAAICLLACFAFAAQSANAAHWKVGLAKTNITPKRLMWMSGYASRTSPANGKRTELWGKAIALEDADGNRAVLLTTDLVGIDRKLSQRLCQQIETKFRLPRAAVAITVSHTHTGPVVSGNLAPTYDLDDEQKQLVVEYTDWLAEQLVAAVGAALDDLQPAKLSYEQGFSSLAVNRRNNPDSEVEARRLDGELRGPVDQRVPVLAAHSLDGKLRAVVFGYACHATVLNDQLWSGDWPGYAQMEIERRHPEAVALFWAGCGADQNPLPRRRAELAEAYGRQIARAVDTVLAGPMRPLSPQLTTRYAEISLSFASTPTRAELEQLAKHGKDADGRMAKQLLADLERDGKLPGEYPYPIQLWKLGNELDWLFLGGEVVVDYSLRLRDEVSPTRLWTTAYANDVMAYIPSRRVLAEGGYEGARSMVYYGLPCPWHESIEEKIMEQVVSMVRADDVRP